MYKPHVFFNILKPQPFCRLVFVCLYLFYTTLLQAEVISYQYSWWKCSYVLYPKHERDVDLNNSLSTKTNWRDDSGAPLPSTFPDSPKFILNKDFCPNRLALWVNHSTFYDKYVMLKSWRRLDLIRYQRNLQFHFSKLILDFEHKYHTAPTTAKQLALNPEQTPWHASTHPLYEKRS